MKEWCRRAEKLGAYRCVWEFSFYRMFMDVYMKLTKCPKNQALELIFIHQAGLSQAVIYTSK